MKSIRHSLSAALACAALLPAAGFASGIIHSAPTESGYTSHPDHAGTAPAAASRSKAEADGTAYASGQSTLGRPASATDAVRTVDASQTRTLNVKCGQTIAFRNGDKTFAWKFDVAAHRPVSLAAISPPDFGAGTLQVYVAPNEGERN
ncbi:CzcE family metal-binding protein [Acidovorax sp. NCPPB 4044]|uniref:CzcE family metal-binding protein n=1 Tax=Acidovorax sp. NCPPB 4044 TaxID=2940490 RepID=UPI0023048A7F|nr:CzcE family metal-binding protein [Acidovorax sp. NCPPB 4044]MDA8519641.1 CzcE family metal-binding protein [Acidovorax sp. NCPPB 4044]